MIVYYFYEAAGHDPAVIFFVRRPQFMLDTKTILVILGIVLKVAEEVMDDD